MARRRRQCGKLLRLSHCESQLAHDLIVAGVGDDLEEIIPWRQADDRHVDPSVGSARVRVSRGKHDGLVARDCATTAALSIVTTAPGTSVTLVVPGRTAFRTRPAASSSLYAVPLTSIKA